ncbi:MAG: hypothetical protein CL424_04690 [Acidimicrobiaceae bacterium]|nr:hypothetical protein [Acidimicrobiaceae bacterium]
MTWRSAHAVPHSHDVRSHRPLVAAIVALAPLAIVACGGGDEPQGDAVRFCAEAAEHRETIIDPPVADEAGLTATLDFYRAMGELAPLAIAEEWNQLVVSLETAAELVPGDPESEQLVAATAYATEPAAYAVSVWLRRNCGVEIPITTIAPQEFEPAITTTVAPPPSTVVDE